jgi:DNA polymerase-3 subunit alpha
MYNDKKTWDLFAEGKTKGVFQLESNLGKSWSKKLAPTSIEELSALIAIIRPGTLKAFVDGKSMTQHFVDRKHGREDVTYLHPSLEEILKTTYGVLVYQEQAMRIAQKIAGFNLQEADELRKAIGKKKADLMAKVKKKFISGAKKVGTVSKEEAEEIFGWIEKSARYSFNKCLDPETVIYVPNGSKMLHELEIGDVVLAPHNNVDIFVEVVDIIQTGPKEVYEIALDSGDTLRCTLDHKLMCGDGQMRPLREVIEQDLEIMCIDHKFLETSNA